MGWSFSLIFVSNKEVTKTLLRDKLSLLFFSNSKDFTLCIMDKIIADVAANDPTLTKLALGSMNIGDAGAIALATACMGRMGGRIGS